MNTILNQPDRRRVLADRLNRENSKLIASFERESSPTPAGKTLPHSYTKIEFRRERVVVRNRIVRVLSPGHTDTTRGKTLRVKYGKMDEKKEQNREQT